MVPWGVNAGNKLESTGPEVGRVKVLLEKIKMVSLVKRFKKTPFFGLDQWYIYL